MSDQLNHALTQNTAPTVSNRIPQLDGLRGLACLVVVISHCYVHCGRYAWPQLYIAGETYVPSRIFYFGYSGVELFFILSGFCLSWPLINRPLPWSYWPKWFVRRCWRILPPYYAAILLFASLNVLFHYYTFDFLGATTNKTDLPTLKDFVVAGSLYGTAFNASFWTLALEWRWYFVFPMLFILSRRIGTISVIILTLPLSIVAHLTMVGSWPAIPLKLGPLLFYLPLFAVGMIASQIFYDNRKIISLITPLRIRILLSIALIVAIIVVPPEPEGWWTFRRIAPFSLLYFALVLFALLDPIGQRLFALRPVVFLGVISYSLYLIHEPIIHYIFGVCEQYHWPPHIQILFFQGILVPVCVALGAAFYYCVEQWFIKGININMYATVQKWVRQGRP